MTNPVEKRIARNTLPNLRADFVDDPKDPAKIFFSAVVGPEVAKLGFRYVKTEVVHITPDSWAALAGVEIDDEIWEVCGEEFKQMTEEEKFQALTAPKPIDIKFKRPKHKDSYYEVLCDEKLLGLKYSNQTITSIVTGGFAERNGVLRGDQLLEVNGRLFEELNEAEIFAILRGPRPLTMQFKRPAAVHLDHEALYEKAERRADGDRATIADPRLTSLGRDHDGKTPVDEIALAEIVRVGAAVSLEGHERAWYTGCFGCQTAEKAQPSPIFRK